MDRVLPDTAARRAPRRRPCRTTLAVLSLAVATLSARGGAPPPVAPREEIFTALDLAGWLRAGVVSVDFPGQAGDRGDAAALFDGDRRSSLRAPGLTEADIVLGLQPAQVLRRVAATAALDMGATVTLTVESEDGGRFQAGRLTVAPGEQAVFRLQDVSCASLTFSVQAGDDGAVALSGLDLVGLVSLQALAIEGAPDTLPEGGSFPLRIRGRDAFGGRPDLSERAQLIVSPQRAAAVLGGRFTPRSTGPITLEARLGTLASPPHSLLVTPLLPPPPAPGIRAGQHSVELTLEGQPPFEIHRRLAGDKSAERIGRTERNIFDDTSVTPGVAGFYSARQVDSFGNPLSPIGPEARARTAARALPGQRTIGRFPILVPIFTDSLQPGQAAAIRAGVQAARLFAYRHTLGRHVFDPVFLDVPGPTPSTAGPLMLGIEARLRELGQQDDRYAAVFAFAADVGGDWGGFRLLGRSGGAFASGTARPGIPGPRDPASAAAWVFLHELHHVGLSLLEEQEGGPLPYPSGHPTEDFGPFGVLGSARGRPFDVGEGWDYVALTLAAHDPWAQLGAPWRRPLEFIDSDGDGLADDEWRLPLDELRLGTDPHSADTDGDGLSDFAELAAGIDRGSNPLSRDSDADGLPDGRDPWPLSNFTGVIRRGERPHFLVGVPHTARPDAPPIEISASWTPQALTLEIVTDTPSDVFVELDGSGALGRWESDVRVDVPGLGPAASDVWAGEARLALRAHHPPLGVFVGRRPVPGALVAAEHEPGGRQRLVAVLPLRLGPGATDVAIPEKAPRIAGLRLRAGTVLGLAFTVRPARERDPSPFEPWPEDLPWVSIFEPGRLLNATLED